MSETLARIQALVARGLVEPSMHALGNLKEHAILLDDVVAGIANATMVEDYPEAGRGPTVLVLQHDRRGNPIHVCGAFRATRTIPRWWSPPTALIRCTGPAIS